MPRSSRDSTESRERKHTSSQDLQLLSLTAERPRDLAHTLARSVQSTQASLDLLCQLRRLLEARVEDVDLGSSLLLGSMTTIRQAHSHCAKVLLRLLSRVWFVCVFEEKR